MIKLVLLGYMASGKSFVGRELAKKIEWDFIDLDEFIENKEQSSTKQIFKEKGEIYFRKIERKYLLELLKEDKKLIIALGGGTPCYYDTMDDLVNNNSIETIYLKVSINTIIKRLTNEKSKRPLIAHLTSNDELVEFVGKHLFERSYFYNKANYIIDANTTVNNIVENSLAKLF